jgi:predicted secreted hydrolase
MLAAVCLSRLLAPAAAEFQPPLKTTDGFAVPQPGRHFEFPRDHGSHPEFKIEWWYVTGHLFGESDRRFGFHATFFRRAGPQPANECAVPASSAMFSNDELHLAHMALLDVSGERFLHEERLNRAGWDAGSSTNTLAVHNGNWFLRLGTNASGPLSLQGSIRAEAAFSLELTPTKPLVVFGENGVSRKGAAPTASSHYLTFSRLTVAGELTLAGRQQAVRGQAWMDHEISSSQLDADQAGWDWASLQLNDGREIMAYRLRKKDGRTDPFSQLAWVDAQGGVTNRNSTQFTWTAVRTWKSPATGGVYPVHVKLTTTDPANGQSVSFTLEPILLQQELSGALGGIPYWEGACHVLNEQGANVGSAYLELTGYVGSLADRFK